MLTYYSVAIHSMRQVTGAGLLRAHPPGWALLLTCSPSLAKLAERIDGDTLGPEAHRQRL